LGLGLHISKKIVEQHGGKLLIKSEENKGTTFTILLPLV
ncbi:MAG: ATP-binding protein, partial [Pedobacter sp.]